jgi:type IV secretion system protein VirB6
MIEIVGSYFDSTLNGYAGVVSQALLSIVWPLFLAGVTIWMLIHGYAVLMGKAAESVVELAWKALKVVIIAGVISPEAARYTPFVIDTVNALATEIAASFVPGGLSGADSATAWSLIQSMDDGLSKLGVAVQKEAGLGGFLSRMDLLVAWLMCSGGTLIFEVVVTFVVLLSKAILAFYVAIGPIFIACLIFRPTARLFESWLSAILSAVVLVWVSFFLCGMTMHVATAMIASTIDASGFLQSTVNLFAQAAGFAAMCCVLALIAWQGPHIAAGLTGGSSIQQGHQLATIVYRMLRSPRGSSGGSADRVAGYIAPGRGPPSRARSDSESNDTNAVPAYRRAAEAGRARWNR